MFSQTSMGLIYLIFNQLPFLWDTSDVEYFPNNTGRKKIIYSENVDKLLKFLDNHLSDPVYINDSTLYINCLYKNSK